MKRILLAAPARRGRVLDVHRQPSSARSRPAAGPSAGHRARPDAERPGSVPPRSRQSSRRPTPASIRAAAEERTTSRSTTAHVQHPMLGDQPIEFFKEDDKYYYVSESKMLPEEIEAKRRTLAPRAPRAHRRAPTPGAAGEPRRVRAERFRGPRRRRVASDGIRLEDVAKTGLPDGGMWRASFAVADINGDGIPDIVAPPDRHGRRQAARLARRRQGRLLGRGRCRSAEDGKPDARFTIDYGGVAVGDIDGDGKQDIVSASHGSGPRVAASATARADSASCGRACRRADFSSQAVALLDADGDGKLDIVASRDGPGQEQKGHDRRAAGARLPEPRRGGLGVQEGRPRRRLLLEQPERLGLRRRRPQETS